MAQWMDHLGLKCPASTFESEIQFFTTSLAPFGIKEHFRLMPLVSAMGDNASKPDFWISAVTQGGPIQEAVTPVHLAFKAKDRAQVDEFYRLGMAAGGKDNGPPGIREMYHKGYYAAFVISPAGHGIEAVFHDWELQQSKQ